MRKSSLEWGLVAGVGALAAEQASRHPYKLRLAFGTFDLGGLVVNDVSTTRMDNMPYGGVKDSGIGREGVKYAMEHMTERRVMLVRKGV